MGVAPITPVMHVRNVRKKNTVICNKAIHVLTNIKYFAVYHRGCS